MKEHSCIIGLLYKSDDCELVTVDDLIKHIQEKKELNQYIETDCGFGEETKQMLRCKTWALKQYADNRIATDLTRFKFCPYCSKPINWKRIGGMDNDSVS